MAASGHIGVVDSEFDGAGRMCRWVEGEQWLVVIISDVRGKRGKLLAPPKLTTNRSLTARQLESAAQMALVLRRATVRRQLRLQLSTAGSSRTKA